MSKKTKLTLIQVSNEMTSKGKRKVGFYEDVKGRVIVKLIK